MRSRSAAVLWLLFAASAAAVGALAVRDAIASRPWRKLADLTGAGPVTGEALAARAFAAVSRGEIEWLAANGLPGFVRDGHVFYKAAIRVRGPQAVGPWHSRGEDPGLHLPLFLLSSNGAWRLAGPIDLPGAARDRQKALERLRLLALCQQALFSESQFQEASGDPPRYAATGRELLDGLARLPDLAGVIDPRRAARALVRLGKALEERSPLLIGCMIGASLIEHACQALEGAGDLRPEETALRERSRSIRGEFFTIAAVSPEDVFAGEGDALAFLRDEATRNGHLAARRSAIAFLARQVSD